MSSQKKGASFPYSGKWVASIGGKIVGQGGTPEAARQAAQRSRHKEKVDVRYMPLERAPLPPEIRSKILALAPVGEIYLVGGALRDVLTGKDSHDYDFVVSGDAPSLARQIAAALGGDFYMLDEAFGAARVIFTGADGTRDVLDMIAMRGGSIESDLAARDFTVNAIAYSLQDQTTLDPCGGAADIRARTVRACSPQSMAQDPVRVLRGIRLAADLGFKIDKDTLRLMRPAAEMLPSVSAERKRDELFKILEGRRADACLRALEMLGVLPYILPELVPLKGMEQPPPHVHDVWEHTLAVVGHLSEMLDLLVDDRVEGTNGIHASLLLLAVGRYRAHFARQFATPLNANRSRRALLQFAALYHDTGKPASLTRGEDGKIHFIGHERTGATLAAERAIAFNLSNAEVAWLESLVREHMRFFFLADQVERTGEAPTRRAVYHFFQRAEPAGVEQILLGLADLRGRSGRLLAEQTWSSWLGVARHLLENRWERPEEAVMPPRLIDGMDLMDALGVPEGPIVGQLMRAIREAQATGEVADRAAALEFARAWMARQGPPAAP